MAGGAISRALDRAGYNQLQTQPMSSICSIHCCSTLVAELKPTVVVLAAKVGGIHANNTYPADTVDNLKIQTNVSKQRSSGVRRFFFGK